jgi:hypothetical protein
MSLLATSQSPRPHHHRTGERHPAAAVPPSILRMGIGERLAIAALMIALIWATALWAMA